MIIRFNKRFTKNYQARISLYPKLNQQAKLRIKLFQLDPKNPIFKDHQLTGAKKELRSFSITGDIRIVYLPVSKNEAIFVDIGSHNQVY